MQRALHVFQPDMTADDPDWIAYFNTAELAATRASAAGYLGDPTIAARHMRTAVDGLGPNSQRNKAYYSVRLGQYDLAAGRSCVPEFERGVMTSAAADRCAPIEAKGDALDQRFGRGSTRVKVSE